MAALDFYFDYRSPYAHQARSAWSFRSEIRPFAEVW